jgi:ATPase subunit of ABC transporter with duplicated ATPase domains
LYFSQKSTESELKNKKLHYEIMDSKEKSTNKNISSFLNKIGITDDEIDDKIVGFNR